MGGGVPFYVLRNGNVSKALFTVPADVVDQLVAYPILCRGSSFTLTIGGAGTKGDTGGSNTIFLEAAFYSPFPDEVAEEIANRLANRIENSGTFRIEDVMEI
jgi:hypothetical protein